MGWDTGTCWILKKGLKRKRYVRMGLQRRILVVHNNVDILAFKKERPRYCTLGQQMHSSEFRRFTDDHSGHSMFVFLRKYS